MGRIKLKDEMDGIEIPIVFKNYLTTTIRWIHFIVYPSPFWQIDFFLKVFSIFIRIQYSLLFLLRDYTDVTSA